MPKSQGSLYALVDGLSLLHRLSCINLERQRTERSEPFVPRIALAIVAEEITGSPAEGLCNVLGLLQGLCLQQCLLHGKCDLLTSMPQVFLHAASAATWFKLRGSVPYVEVMRQRCEVLRRKRIFLSLLAAAWRGATCRCPPPPSSRGFGR